jgi:hypothetical protein
MPTIKLSEESVKTVCNLLSDTINRIKENPSITDFSLFIRFEGGPAICYNTGRPTTRSSGGSAIGGSVIYGES